MLKKFTANFLAISFIFGGSAAYADGWPEAYADVWPERPLLTEDESAALGRPFPLGGDKAPTKRFAAKNSKVLAQPNAKPYPNGQVIGVVPLTPAIDESAVQETADATREDPDGAYDTVAALHTGALPLLEVSCWAPPDARVFVGFPGAANLPRFELLPSAVVPPEEKKKVDESINTVRFFGSFDAESALGGQRIRNLGCPVYYILFADGSTQEVAANGAFLILDEDLARHQEWQELTAEVHIPWASVTREAPGDYDIQSSLPQRAEVRVALREALDRCIDKIDEERSKDPRSRKPAVEETFTNHYFSLVHGGFAPTGALTLLPGCLRPKPLEGASFAVKPGVEVFALPCKRKPGTRLEFNAENGTVTVIFEDAKFPDDAPLPDVHALILEKSELFDSGVFRNAGENGTAVLHFKDAEKFWGYEVIYRNDMVFLVFHIKPVLAANGELPLSGRVVWLDAGHGGREAGAVHQGIFEKDINLAQVQDLKLLLETFGAVVHETRTPQDEAQGRTVTLDERPQLVAALPGPPPDLLISVHANSATPRRDPNHICGVETFWYWPQSQNLAEQLLSFLPAACDQNARRAERAAYRVALFPQFPSVLTERGFMVCPWELELLCDEEAMHKHSVGYLGAILNCLLPKPLPVRLLLDVLTRTEQDEIERTNLLELLRLLGSLLTPQTAPIVREIWTRMEHGVITLTGVLDLLRTVTTAITKLPRPLVRAVLLGLTSGEITADTIPDLMSRLMGQAEEKHQVEEQPTLEAPATLEGVEAKEQQKTTVAADQM